MIEKKDDKVAFWVNAGVVIITMLITLASLSQIGQNNSSPPIAVMTLIRLYVIYMIIRNGGMLQSKLYSILLVVCGLLVAVGSMFKIMHWIYSTEILVSGFVIAAIFYTIRFFLKKEKLLLDYLKWIWVMSAAIMALVVIMHWYTLFGLNSGHELAQIPFIFFLAMLLVYLREMIQVQRAAHV